MKNSNLLNSMRYYSTLPAEERQGAMAMMNAEPVTSDIFIFFANMATVQQEQATATTVAQNASEVAANEDATEAATEAASDATNEDANEATTDAATDATTDAANDATTDAATEAATDTDAEAATDATCDAATDAPVMDLETACLALARLVERPEDDGHLVYYRDFEIFDDPQYEPFEPEDIDDDDEPVIPGDSSHSDIPSDIPFGSSAPDDTEDVFYEYDEESALATIRACSVSHRVRRIDTVTECDSRPKVLLDTESMSESEAAILMRGITSQEFYSCMPLADFLDGRTIENTPAELLTDEVLDLDADSLTYPEDEPDARYFEMMERLRRLIDSHRCLLFEEVRALTGYDCESVIFEAIKDTHRSPFEREQYLQQSRRERLHQAARVWVTKAKAIDDIRRYRNHRRY